MSEEKQTTLAEIKRGGELSTKEELPGFLSRHGMQLLEQAANMLTFSTLVPDDYRHQKTVRGKLIDNPAGFSNCVVAVNLAQQKDMDPITVMQNLHVIGGRPSWSAQFIIAQVNNCSAFSRLAFEVSDKGSEVEVEYVSTKWENGSPIKEVKKALMRHQRCFAWAKDRETGAVLKGPEITVQMAIDEGWALKDGSKWHTMQELMLQYRAAAFWCRLHAPELLHGLPTADEAQDTLEADIKDGSLHIRPTLKEDLGDPQKEAKPDRKARTQEAQDVELAEGKEPIKTDMAEEAKPVRGRRRQSSIIVE